VSVKVQIKQLPHAKGLSLPGYKTHGAAGADVVAAVPKGNPLTIYTGERAAVPTGITVAIPDGYEIQVRPRSGLARNHGIQLVNAPGTIDADYRGEIHVLLINMGHEPFVIERGDRIAQLVLSEVPQIMWDEVDELPSSERGHGGFGSTGTG
jgi:dUTP pyrophosphatase